MRLHVRVEKCWSGSLMIMGAAAVMGIAHTVAVANAAPVDQPMGSIPAIPGERLLKDVPSVDYGDGEGERVSVLVQFAPALTRGAVQRTKAEALYKKHGAHEQYSYDKVLPNVVNIRDIPLSQLPALRKMPGVVRVERDKMVHAYLDDSTPLIRALQSQIAAAGFSASGANVRVCIVDTGIDSDNQMYASRIDTAAGRDFVNNDNNPEDDEGHGSHVSGIALGGTGISRTVCGVSKPFQGVAPNATLIGVKVLDSTGNGTFSNVIAGINYCADQTASGGRADVISMSLGGGQFSGTCDSDSGAAAANNAVNAGVVVIASSGNDGFANAMGTPACGSQVISVGATYDADFPNCANSTSTWNWGICTDNNPTVDSIVCFSNKSDFLDVVAPGCNTTSASNAAGGTSVTSMCGTSMAAPHVTGLAALILSADPTLTPAQVRQIIRDGAVDLGATGFDRTFGYGRIDAINSLQLVGPGCTTNADCNDNDPCTTDTCSAGACSFTPISCPGGQICIGGTCQGQGACCNGLTCNIDTQSNCSGSGGSYLGDGTVCGSGTAGNPTVYSSAPSVAIPDGGGAGNPATDSINVPDTFNIGDVDVDLDISHTWVGDVTVSVSHLGTTVTVLDRPGVPSSTYGCSLDNFVGILLDDEGTGGTIESQCTTNLSSPPNYTPNNALTAFDGLDAAGTWTITVYDSVSADSGTLNSWSLHIDAVGTNPCATPGCTTNADCDDGVFCNGAETCNAGTCQSGTPPTCNDGVACTDDSCNTGTDSCDNVANNANCDDGLACNGAETCSATLDCQAGTPVNCNDGVACTTDACNEPGGTCSNTPNNAACDDGVFCNGTETCDAVLDCQAGTAPSCNDGVACTDDSCNTGTDSCQNVANNANCDDGLACNGAETCDAVNDCQAGTAVNCNDGIACTADACNEPGGTCSNTPDNAACDDGLACNGVETCDALLDCQAGTAVNCNDGVACTTDACNEPGGTCSNTANNAACDDGLFCNGTETCDSILDCQAGTAVNCNDGVACTDDSCNETTNSCDNVANNANCDDGLFCNGAETCDALLDCQAGANPCPSQSCNETTNTCVSCLTNADCDDGLACNGAETCVGGACQAGTAVNCNDGVACTADACNEPGGTCSNTPDNAACDDGLACNGVETCDALLDCQAGTAVNCNDGVACTTDACNEPGGTCSNTANNAACDDGLFCNGTETCDPILDCQAGTAVNCNDGVVCTTDSCNEATNSCDNVPSNAACDDGLFCNGAETCDAVLDCQAGTAVNCNDGVGCTDDSCNEATTSCDNVANNANCPDDGLFCTGTEFCDPAADCSSTGNPCLAGETCNEATNACDPGVPAGEGFILSKNADLSTDDRTFTVADTLYMRVWTDVVNFNDINRARWELKDANKNKIRQPMTNNFDGTYTASFALSGLPSTAISWTWKGDIKDNAGLSYKPTTTITVLAAPACSVNADCDDGDACTTDVCSGGSCSNTPVNCNDGDACTADSCDPGTGLCSNVAISCDDGDACTTDTCDSVAGCSNTPINCNDGDPCTSDSCSGGVCFNNPLPTCCGDGFCDVGEDSCNCPADCGAPPATETNCTDGIDEDCDGATDCADTDCNADPACSTPTGEGFILSLNADFSTDDRTFTRADTMYMLLWSDVVNFNDINRTRWELKDANKNKVRQPMTNNFDGTYTASFALSGLPSTATSWTWKGEAKDNAGNRYKPSVTVTVLP